VKTEPHPRGPDENVWFEKQLENVDTAETLLQTVIGFLHELPGKSLDEVIYCPLPHELGEDNIDVPLLYIGGEVKMRFRNLAPRYLGWDSNTGWGGAYSLRIALQTRFRPEFLEERVANQLSIWSRFVGTPLRHIDVLGWEGVPYICRFGFDAGEIYIGSGYQFAFGDGDDLIIATEEGWQSLDLKAPNIESPALLAHLSSGQNPKSEIRNPKSI
jgi:hypothetical protein